MEEINRINFEQVYIAYFSKMKRFAKEYVVSEADAENVVHDVFLDMWEKRDTLVSRINLVAYLFTSVKNRCIDCLRRRILEQEAATSMQEEYLLTLRMKFDSLTVFDHRLLAEDDVESILSRAIATLPDKCREIFIKSKIEGRKQKEIAEEFDVSINTVEKQIGIAYKKLREELKNYLPLLLFLSVL